MKIHTVTDADLVESVLILNTPLDQPRDLWATLKWGVLIHCKEFDRVYFERDGQRVILKDKFPGKEDDWESGKQQKEKGRGKTLKEALAV